MNSADEIAGWSSAKEGQFFERKSALDRSTGQPKRRKAADVAWDIAETLAAMANADGGALVVGMEDDGEVTGVPHPEDRINLFLRAAGDRNYLTPLLRFTSERLQTSDGKLLLVFAVDWSPEVHHLADGRYVLRVNDANVPFAAEQIAALKATKAQGLFERAFPPGASLTDIDGELVLDCTPKTRPVAESTPPE